ncbi:MAG: acyl-CoA/acyl-ACP dehydrogenase [Proteobacteria bacterium]|nr:acyl-CoA/acyl-ACP dehydrogenase [Pseudomonadota bacterium]MDA1058816.1 acyl-CoA/acyl-ACP dehydrogenase [Pseudomonadota bacterium]
MDFSLNDDQRAIQDAVGRIAARFDETYWLTRDHEGGFPHEFADAMAKDGWLGVAMPQAYGGAGLGITEAALMMQTVACGPGAFGAASSVHLNIFGLNPVVVFGTEEQRARMLPPIIKGEHRACFGVTEPDAGLDTGSIKTKAVRDGDTYIVQGRKVWTSTAQEADHILLLVRTTPRNDGAKGTDGLSLFYTKLDRDYVTVREIDKMGRKAVDSNEVFIDDLPVPLEDRIGEEGLGFRYLLHGLNPERILVAAEAIGIGRYAIQRAAKYAGERIVFGRPIGQNQAIQHPLAESWAELEAADLLMLKAAQLYDTGQACGAEANAAKYLAAEVAYRACERAVLTHGGYGYAKEFVVERLLREVMIARLAPVSQQLILCYIAERVLGLPKSY